MIDLDRLRSRFLLPTAFSVRFPLAVGVLSIDCRASSEEDSSSEVNLNIVASKVIASPKHSL